MKTAPHAPEREWAHSLRQLVEALGEPDLSDARLEHLTRQLSRGFGVLRASAGASAHAPAGEVFRAATLLNAQARQLVARQLVDIQAKRARVGEARKWLSTLRAPAAIGDACDVTG